MDDHHITYLTKLNSTKLFWATTRSMQNTIKAEQVTHMKTKPKFLCALKFQDMKDLFGRGEEEEEVIFGFFPCSQMCSHPVPMGFPKFQSCSQDFPNSASALSNMVCPKSNSHVYKLKKGGP